MKYIRIFLVCVALYYFLFYIPDIRQPKAQKKEESLLLQHLLTADEADYVPIPEATRPETTPLEKLSPAETLQAQIKTTDFLEAITKDDAEKLDAAQEAHVVDAFNALVAHAPDAKNKILEMQLPEEVRSSVAMLSQYQWKFIQQAEELRNMAVAKIVKETDHPDARIRLKALDMLGKVTEVALFTERIEVKKAEVTDEELEKRIKEKLGKYMGIADVVEKEIIDVEYDTEENASQEEAGNENSSEEARSQKDGEEE